MNLRAIFQDFEKVVRSNSNISISLFDPNGQLVASSQYGDTDLDLRNLQDNQTHVVVYRIKIRDSFYGYLVIKTKEVYKYLNEIGAVLFETFKTRIELEVEKEQRARILSTNEKLTESIIYDDNVNVSLNLMKQVSLRPDVFRIPIICLNSLSFTNDVLINLKYKINDNQTFYSKINENTIILFMHVNSNQLDGYEAYLISILKELEDWGLDHTTFYLGTLVNHVKDYQPSYHQALWLKDYLSIPKGKILFFKNYYLTYLIANNKSSYFSFEGYLEKIKQQKMDIVEVQTILESLLDNDFNLSRTAKTMFIHKNTLIYRINKLEREIFGFNIRNDFKNKIFVSSFLVYIKYIKIR